MASLNDFSAAPIKDEVDFDNLPKQGAWEPPPPAAKGYRFQIPATLDVTCFEPIDHAEYGPRVRVKFDNEHPLVVTQAPPPYHEEYVNTPFATQLSNVPRARGKAKVLASDVDYLLQALGEKARPKSVRDYVATLIKYAGASFTADLEYSWSCNAERSIWVEDGNGGQTEVPETKGCGRKYYQQGVPKVDGKVPFRITCECGASVRAFANLQAIRA